MKPSRVSLILLAYKPKEDNDQTFEQEVEPLLGANGHDLSSRE